MPDEVLGQLGNRVQHALRAFTPDDAAALAKAVRTYPKTKDYDLAEALQQLGTEEPSTVESVLKSSAFKSFARSAATVLGREITRGIFGTHNR